MSLDIKFLHVLSLNIHNLFGHFSLFFWGSRQDHDPVISIVIQ